MTTTAVLRSLFEPHLPLFGDEHRAAFEQLVRLAVVGERALALLSPAALRAETSNTKKGTAPRAGRPTNRAAKTASKGDASSARAAKGDGPSLRDTVLTALKEAGNPLALSELEAVVKSRGYTSTSANFGKLLSLTIVKMKNELRRVGRGVYALA